MTTLHFCKSMAGILATQYWEHPHISQFHIFFPFNLSLFSFSWHSAFKISQTMNLFEFGIFSGTQAGSPAHPSSSAAAVKVHKNIQKRACG